MPGAPAAAPPTSYRLLRSVPSAGKQCCVRGDVRSRVPQGAGTAAASSTAARATASWIARVMLGLSMSGPACCCRRLGPLQARLCGECWLKGSSSQLPWERCRTCTGDVKSLWQSSESLKSLAHSTRRQQCTIRPHHPWPSAFVCYRYSQVRPLITYCVAWKLQPTLLMPSERWAFRALPLSGGRQLRRATRRPR